MKIRILLTCLIVVIIPCIAKDMQVLDVNNHWAHAFKERKPLVVTGDWHSNMWNRLEMQGVKITKKDVRNFMTEVRNNIGEESFNALIVELDKESMSFAILGATGQFDRLLESCHRECDILASYYELETLPAQRAPTFSIERRMQAVLKLLAIYNVLELTAGGKEDQIKDLTYEIENALKGIHITYMTTFDQQDRN